jgi:hypothetical protein
MRSPSVHVARPLTTPIWQNDTDIVVHDSDEIIDDNSMAQIIDMTEGFEEVTDDELPSTSHATPTTHCQNE